LGGQNSLEKFDGVHFAKKIDKHRVFSITRTNSPSTTVKANIAKALNISREGASAMSVTIRANTPYGANIIMISTIFNAMAFPVSSTFLTSLSA